MSNLLVTLRVDGFYRQKREERSGLSIALASYMKEPLFDDMVSGNEFEQGRSAFIREDSVTSNK